MISSMSITLSVISLPETKTALVFRNKISQEGVKALSPLDRILETILLV